MDVWIKIEFPFNVLGLEIAGSGIFDTRYSELLIQKILPYANEQTIR